MAKSGKTAQEFIKDSFSPIVAVLCSTKVDHVVAKNNLTFTELLQPFTTMDWEGHIKEPGGALGHMKNWKLIIRDINWKPLQPTEARRQLNNAVLHNYHDKTITLEYDRRKFDIPQSTYWFDAWRETYFDVQFPSDHEFTKHFLSCIIVGVAHDDNIIDTFNSLNQQYAILQNVTPPKLPKWFNSGILKSYLLLHDASVISREKADVAFETLKQTFGSSNCFILTINSKSASDPILNDMWAPCIKRTSDVNNEIPMSASNQPQSPAEPTSTYMSVNLEDGSMLTTPMQSDTSHPLISPDNDVYDNANSLQTHSFSGSSESVNVSSKGIDVSMELHGGCLNMNDIDDIKKFLQDYAQKNLLPHLEKLIAQLSESVANRKGVSRSLLSATKRWFGTGKTGNTAGNNTVIYTNDCPELQLRRLGDLWFMCGQWQRAFDVYHTAKREFYADSAWLFYAGALEMAALSAFMAGEASRKTHGYMEESIVTYLNTCRMVQYAVRATLLSVLCLNSAGLHGEAAKQLIRMTSEDSDLRSAMLLEQAALCFLSGPGTKAMCRKYAFHMVLAGHRFSKAGQKKHAYRCYNQAYQVYGSSGWRLATDHVQFALGRLAGALRAPAEALRWLAAPLAHSPAAAHHLAAQHHAFLREYMHHFQQWASRAEERRGRAVLPVPAVAARASVVACAGPAPLSSPRRAAASSLSAGAPPAAAAERAWHRLEEMLLQVAQGAVPMIFKPTVDLYDETTDCDPVVPKGEPVQISITLWNPLKVAVVLREVELLWRFSGGDAESEELDNEPAVAAGRPLDPNVIFSQKISSAILEGDSEKVLMFTLTPMKVGRLLVHGLAYHLVNIGEGDNEAGSGLSIPGKLNLLSGVKNTDRRLQITVIPEAPCLQMTFSETNTDILSGEMRTIDVEFTNVGPVEMKNLHIAVSHPECISLVTPEDDDDNFKWLYEEKFREPPAYPEERLARAAARARVCARHVWAVRGAGAAGGGAGRRVLQLRALAAAPHPRLLAYYETGLSARPYRLLRHQFRFRVHEAVEVSVTPRRNVGPGGGAAVENMNLAVEVKNVCPDRSDSTVELVEASLVGRQWRLEELRATPARNQPLEPRERIHFVLKARRLTRPLSEEKMEFSRLRISDLNNDKHLVGVPSYSKFATDSTQSFNEMNDPLIIQQKTQPAGLIQSIFILRWKVSNKSTGAVAIGQHCLWLDCFSKTLSQEHTRTPLDNPSLQLDESEIKTEFIDSSKKNKKENVVLFGLQHSKEIKHDFKERKICLIPITLNIVNCYAVPVQVFIDMSKQKNRECSGELGWAGSLSGTGAEGKGYGVSVSLESFESRQVRVSGVCAAPGTYLLGPAFTLSARSPLPAPLPATLLADNHSLLVVTAADN